MTHFQQIVKSGRRPLLHVVVLYAFNAKVVTYARSVSDVFIASGIDVYYQTTLRHRDSVHIARQDMFNVIVASHADFVVVIGDKNMRHCTVQRTSKSSLAEITVADMQRLIWKNWPQNPMKNYQRIQSIADAELDRFVEQYTGKKLYTDRVEVIKNCKGTLGSALPGDVASFQEFATRLHQQLVAAHLIISSLRQGVDNFEQTRGAYMSAQYRPNGHATSLNTIAPHLQSKLCAFLEKQMADIETVFDVPRMAMLQPWRDYIAKHHALWSPRRIEEPPVPVAVDAASVVLPQYEEPAPALVPSARDYDKTFPSLASLDAKAAARLAFEAYTPPLKVSTIQHVMIDEPVLNVDFESPEFRAIARIWNDPGVIKAPFYSYF